MKSILEKEIVASSDVQAQPRLQRNALNLFQILSSNLAVLAPAEGIFLSIGLAVAFLGSRAPWAFLIAAVAILTTINTLSEFSRVRPSAGSFISLIGNSLQGYSPKLAVFVSTIRLPDWPRSNRRVPWFLGEFVCTRSELGAGSRRRSCTDHATGSA